MKTNQEKSSELARFLMTPNAFNILKLLAEHPEGMDLEQLAETLELSRAIVLAVLHEAWELGVVEPVTNQASISSSHSHSASTTLSPEFENFELSFMFSNAESPLLNDLPLRDFLERQAFLISASKEIGELKSGGVLDFDTTSLTPLMRAAIEHRMNAGIKTLFHLSSWAMEMFAQVTSVEEMTEYLKQHGLLR